MNFISKLFKKKEEETEVVSKGSVEEFVTLIRVYYQAVMAVQLGNGCLRSRLTTTSWA